MMDDYLSPADMVASVRHVNARLKQYLDFSAMKKSLVVEANLANYFYFPNFYQPSWWPDSVSFEEDAIEKLNFVKLKLFLIELKKHMVVECPSLLLECPSTLVTKSPDPLEGLQQSLPLSNVLDPSDEGVFACFDVYVCDLTFPSDIAGTGLIHDGEETDVEHWHSQGIRGRVWRSHASPKPV